jgi:acid phosphatase (class A)
MNSNTSKTRLLVIALLVVVAPSAFAMEGETDTPVFLRLKKVLGPYPALGTAESDRDFEILRNYQNTRTDAECAAAAREEKGTLKNFFGGKGGLLTKKEVNHFSLLMLHAKAAVGLDQLIGKLIYRRPRPFVTDSEIQPCIKRPKSLSYPSGHATASRAYARILSVMYPERAGAFMERAEEIAMHRVLGGVHHPSDIEAGKRLGDAIADHLLEEAGLRSEILSQK